MFRNFLNLEWKSFFRSASFGKSIGTKILMSFFALYFIVMFLVGGFFMDKILKELYPDTDSFIAFNGFIFYWILGDLVVRFFFQKLPVMSVKPLLTLPVRRSSIVNFVLGKSVMSFINFLPLFAIIPFGLKLIAGGSEVSVILIWIVILIIITLINNFLNFIIESLSAETELSFFPIILIVSGLYALNYFDIVNLTEILSDGILSVSRNGIFIIVPLAILGALYGINFKILRQKLFLDASLKTKIQEVNTSNMEWTKNFGDIIAAFMQLDLKLIWRNKRSKTTLWMLGLGLFYGLFFYPNPTYADKPWFFVFIGIFVTGIFLMNFGQFIPAWDSSYYKLLMSQNIKYEKYLKSKFILMAMSVIILFVLSIPYVYFGWEILLAHLAAAIYNVGVNTHVIMYGGSYNRKKINLDQKAAFNYQGTGAVQWLIGIPILIVPALIFGAFYALFGFEIGCLVIGFIGVLGIVLHQKLMKIITKKYLASKYKMIHAFDQEN